VRGPLENEETGPGDILRDGSVVTLDLDDCHEGALVGADIDVVVEDAKLSALVEGRERQSRVVTGIDSRSTGLEVMGKGVAAVVGDGIEHGIEGRAREADLVVVDAIRKARPPDRFPDEIVSEGGESGTRDVGIGIVGVVAGDDCVPRLYSGTRPA